MAAPSASVRTLRKRTYSGPGALLSDMVFILRNFTTLRHARRKGLMSQAFQERLMLSVTAVNGCRYCSYFHAREALKSGVAQDELTQLLVGIVDGCPDDEAVALLYAHHWAETDARPDREAVRRLQQDYGVQRSSAIHVVLRMIRVGNLLGNSWDSCLHRFSFGRLGGV